MAVNESPTPTLIGRVAARLTVLPPEDLRLVIDFLDLLEERHAPQPAPSSVARIREEAKRRAGLLKDVPREQLAARFAELAEQVRQEAIEKGTAVEGDWVGD
ncbi:MAG: hypothetical protein ABUT39_07950 [Acidobacteriota bacterium]